MAKATKAKAARAESTDETPRQRELARRAATQPSLRTPTAPLKGSLINRESPLQPHA